MFLCKIQLDHPVQREPTYANAVVQRQMRRDEESHYANADVKNTSPWIGGGGGGSRDEWNS